MIVAGLRVDQDDAEPFLAERFAGLGAGIVELASLTDDDRPGSDDQDALDIVAHWHVLPLIHQHSRAALMRSLGGRPRRTRAQPRQFNLELQIRPAIDKATSATKSPKNPGKKTQSLILTLVRYPQEPGVKEFSSDLPASIEQLGYLCNERRIITACQAASLTGYCGGLAEIRMI
jgi:hypothetical protein